MIKKFFARIWAFVEILRRVVVTLGIIAFLVVIALVINGGKPVVVEDNIALVFAPTGEVVDQIDIDPRASVLAELSGEPPQQTLLRDLIDTLDYAAADDRIAVVILKLDLMTSIGMAQAQELAAAIQRFRQSGKPVYAYGPGYDQRDYYLAVQADKIFMDPLGLLLIEGFSTYQQYFAEALEKLGVSVNVFRVGDYKSAVEPFVRRDMSEEAKEANLAWLGDLWTVWRQQVASARNIQPADVDAFIADYPENLAAQNGDVAAMALEKGWVDELVTRQQLREKLIAMVEQDEDHGSFRQMHSRPYLRVLRRENQTLPQEKQVGVIVAQGALAAGNSDTGVAGSDTIGQLISQARRDDNIAALVLRVNSPGGGVYASEFIRRELALAQADGKPVVVSMSNVAASGGYWISMNADRIFAMESTITGSIGIFGLFPTFEKPLGKLGVHTDGVGTTPLAGAFRGDRPLSDEVATSIQWVLNDNYRRFTQGVANGRSLAVDQVKDIAQGRVWSGVAAKERGLVDSYGGLQTAIDAAAALANLNEFDVEYVAPPEDIRMKLLRRFSFSAGQWLPESLLDHAAQKWGLAGWQKLREMASWMRDPNHAYAHCLCEVDGKSAMPPQLSSSAPL